MIELQAPHPETGEMHRWGFLRQMHAHDGDFYLECNGHNPNKFEKDANGYGVSLSTVKRWSSDFRSPDRVPILRDLGPLAAAAPEARLELARKALWSCGYFDREKHNIDDDIAPRIIEMDSARRSEVASLTARVAELEAAIQRQEGSRLLKNSKWLTICTAMRDVGILPPAGQPYDTVECILEFGGRKKRASAIQAELDAMTEARNTIAAESRQRHKDNMGLRRELAVEYRKVRDLKSSNANLCNRLTARVYDLEAAEDRAKKAILHTGVIGTEWACLGNDLAQDIERVFRAMESALDGAQGHNGRLLERLAELESTLHHERGISTAAKATIKVLEDKLFAFRAQLDPDHPERDLSWWRGQATQQLANNRRYQARIKELEAQLEYQTHRANFYSQETTKLPELYSQLAAAARPGVVTLKLSWRSGYGTFEIVGYKQPQKGDFYLGRIYEPVAHQSEKDFDVLGSREGYRFILRRLDDPEKPKPETLNLRRTVPHGADKSAWLDVLTACGFEVVDEPPTETPKGGGK